jgi:signal-transduction protein with cAMP-binding, CBS, and nucleotidyltransferase domain
LGPNFFAYGGAPADDASDRNKAILKSLEEDGWEKLVAFGAVRRYQPGATILTLGSSECALHFVMAGTVRVVAGDTTSMNEGNVFGLSAFLDGESSAIEAVAEGAVDLFLLSRPGFEQLAAWHPRIAVTLLRDLGAELSSRLRRHGDPA